MELDKVIKSLKYVPKIWTALSYPILLLLSLILFFGRNLERIRINLFLNKMNDFYEHISNFSFSFIIYVTIGYVGLMAGLTLRYIIVIGLIILLLNLFIEYLIPFLNTPDMVDGIYGIFGVVLGFVFLYIVKKYGLKKNEL